jgi:Ca2+-binding EF-hand superfamily protein
MGRRGVEEILHEKFSSKCSARVKLESFITKIFKYYDLADTGECTEDGFLRAVQDYSAGLPIGELRATFRRYAVHSKLDYRSFALLLATGNHAALDGKAAAPEQPRSSFDAYFLSVSAYITRGGASAVVALARAFQRAGDSRTRTILRRDAIKVLVDYLKGSEVELQPEQAAVLTPPDEVIPYDRLVMQFRSEPDPAGRQLVRQAFRKLDPQGEGVVDLDVIVYAYNASRYPKVVEGTATAEAVESEFLSTLVEWIKFRRSEEEPNLCVTWEEFEDYYIAVHSCFADFVGTFTKVWDLDKTYRPNESASNGALGVSAGLPPKSRVGLHHWQPDTLPSAAYRDSTTSVDLDDVVERTRAAIAQSGIRGAMRVLQIFIDVDDDLDNFIDRDEFFSAAQTASLRFSAAEEEAIFAQFGSREKMPVFGFLSWLHGKLSGRREAVVKEAFASFGRAGISPPDLRARFTPEAHPSVVSGHTKPEEVLQEFLDTFALAMRLTGGVQQGEIKYEDFKSYYTVMSSTIPSDSFFELLARRLWGLEKVPQMPEDIPSPRGPAAAAAVTDLNSPRRAKAAATSPAQALAIDRAVYQPTAAGEARELAPLWERLRAAIARRGLKGWRVLLAQVATYDSASSGRMVKKDWLHLLRTAGLGVSADEAEAIVRIYCKDGYIHYGEVLRAIRGQLTESRAELVDDVWKRLADGDTFDARRLLSIDISSYPTVALGTASPKDAFSDWEAAIKYWAPEDGRFGEEDLRAFFTFASATILADDEFRLLVSSIG